MIAPQIPRPAPSAITRVCNTVTALLKNAINFHLGTAWFPILSLSLYVVLCVKLSLSHLIVLTAFLSDQVLKGRIPDLRLIALCHILFLSFRGSKKDTSEKLYIEVVSHNGDDKVKVIITGDHTHFSFISKNGQTLLEDSQKTSENGERPILKLTMRQVYDFSMTAPLEEIDFIRKTAEINRKAAEMSLRGNYGHALGKTIFMEHKSQIFGDGIYAKILAYTSAACDARMAGAKVPVMSNSGSGNQGIAATLPVWVYATERLKTDEELIRALMLSHLTVIYIKQSFGRLSPLCGCVVAATGSACGITYLMGGDYDQVVYAIKNMIANITGMICDGAKPSCSLKVATGVSTAILSAMLAIENESVSSVEGIIDDDIEKCVQNMANIGLHGMAETDNLVLEMMTQK